MEKQYNFDLGSLPVVSASEFIKGKNNLGRLVIGLRLITNRPRLMYLFSLEINETCACIILYKTRI